MSLGFYQNDYLTEANIVDGSTWVSTSRCMTQNLGINSSKIER